MYTKEQETELLGYKDQDPEAPDSFFNDSISTINAMFFASSSLITR